MDGLERFILAQGSQNRFGENNKCRFDIELGNGYADALKEIKSGKKCGHWIWYIFPQLKGLGYNYNSSYYGICNSKEASDYLSHPILGLRLREITQELLNLPSHLTAEMIFGRIDALKARFSLTLFISFQKKTYS